MLLIVLLITVLDNGIRDLLGLIRNHIEISYAILGSLIYFAVFCLAIILVPIICLCMMENRPAKSFIQKMVKLNLEYFAEQVVTKKMKFMLQLLVAILYYFGDNIDYFVLHYCINTKDCSDTSKMDIEVAKQAILGTALTIIHILPILESEKCDDGCKEIYCMLRATTILIKIDLIYSIVTAISHTDIDCSDSNQDLSWSFFSIATSLGWISIACQLSQAPKGAIKCKMGCCIGILFIVGLPAHLLSDNRQPLDCSFNCSIPENKTLFSCDDNGLYISRFVVSILTAISVVTTVIWGYMKLRKKRKSSMRETYELNNVNKNDS